MRTEILEFLLKKLPEGSKLSILAGHYALFPNDNKTRLLPGILKDLPSGHLKTKFVEGNHYAGFFPEETMRFGVKLARKLNGGQFVNLVNDWRWVPKGVWGEEQRLDYFRNSDLPDTTLWVLARGFEMESAMVQVPSELRIEGNRFNWSEAVLREQYKSHAYQVCGLEDGCAQEFVPLLRNLDQMAYSDFVALIPGSCKEPTVEASRSARKEFGLKMKVWTLYFYNTTKEETFWDGVEVFEDGEQIM